MTLALALSLRPSRFGLGLLSFHALPLMCLAGEGVPAWMRGLVGLLVSFALVSSFWRIRRDWRRCLYFDAAGEVFLREAPEREALAIDLLASSVDLGWLVALHWRELASGRRGRACLLRDGLSGADWRRLRLCLRQQLRA